MTKEATYFVLILSDHLAKRKTSNLEGIDWHVIEHLARAHQVTGIVYYQCRDYIPREMLPSFEEGFVSTLYLYQNRKAALKEISETFNNSICYVVVKGPEIAIYYPVPDLRTMGDCDLLIAKSDWEKAIELMRDLGYKGQNDTDIPQWGCQKENFFFELHKDLIQGGEYTNNKQEQFFNDYEPYNQEGHLDWNFHYLFLLMHLRKHFMNSGVGIRQFMDLVVVAEGVKNLDWPWISQRMSELGLEKFAGVCFSILKEYFGTNIPIVYTELDDGFIDTVMERIINNGVFGKLDTSNRTNIAKNNLIFHTKYRSAYRIRKLAQKLFPPYESMVEYPNCDYLRKKPYLLPLTWFYRFYLLCKRKNKQSMLETLRNCLISNRELDERKDFLLHMGLYDD